MNIEDLSVKKEMLLFVDHDQTIIHNHNGRTVMRPGLENTLEQQDKRFVCMETFWGDSRNLLLVEKMSISKMEWMLQ